jgi:L-iditol 2-dehydrogenase
MEYAAIGEPPSSCINAQEKLEVGLGDTMLIIGGGPIGCINTNVAKAHGASRVMIADIKYERLELCAAFDPDDLVDAADGDLVKKIMELTDGRGVDVVITANPAAKAQQQALNIAKKGGRIAFFGGLLHGNSIVELDTNLIHYRSLKVIGTTGFAPRHHLLSLKLLQQRKIYADKLVTHILPLEDFQKGVQLAMDGQAMKVVYKIFK